MDKLSLNLDSQVLDGTHGDSLWFRSGRIGRWIDVHVRVFPRDAAGKLESIDDLVLVRRKTNGELPEVQSGQLSELSGQLPELSGQLPELSGQLLESNGIYGAFGVLVVARSSGHSLCVLERGRSRPPRTE